MNLQTILAAAGVNLSDIKLHAEKVIGEAKNELDRLHKKIDAQSQALILLDQKLDALIAQGKGGDGNASSGNDNRENGNNNRNVASSSGVTA